jgi:hypothetical protein
VYRKVNTRASVSQESSAQAMSILLHYAATAERGMQMKEEDLCELETEVFSLLEHYASKHNDSLLGYHASKHTDPFCCKCLLLISMGCMVYSISILGLISFIGDKIDEQCAARIVLTELIRLRNKAHADDATKQIDVDHSNTIVGSILTNAGRALLLVPELEHEIFLPVLCDWIGSRSGFKDYKRTEMMHDVMSRCWQGIVKMASTAKANARKFYSDMPSEVISNAYHNLRYSACSDTSDGRKEEHRSEGMLAAMSRGTLDGRYESERAEWQAGRGAPLVMLLLWYADPSPSWQSCPPQHQALQNPSGLNLCQSKEGLVYAHPTPGRQSRPPQHQTPQSLPDPDDCEGFLVHADPNLYQAALPDTELPNAELRGVAAEPLSIISAPQSPWEPLHTS